MSDFAKNQLLKFGWSEGKGLGKNENGITKPIKVTLKSGLEGLGCNETSDTWWEKKYNSAIQNIQVDSSQDGVTLSTLNDSWDFSKMKENKPKMHSLYPNFQKISILHNGCLMQDNSTTSEEKVETGQTIINVPLPIEQLHITSNNEVMPNMATRTPCMSNIAKLERIALQDQSLISAMPHSSYNNLLKYSPSACSNTLRPIFSKYSLSEYSSPFKCTSVIKPRCAMLNKLNETSEKKEEEEKYETNNNIMLRTLRMLNSVSKSRNKKFKKKLNNLMQQLNSCSIKETESKCDLVKDQFLRNVKNNRKKCLKTKGKFEYAQFIKKKDLESCTVKEDINKQARSQNEKEYRPVQVILEMNNDTPSSKEESYKPPHESLMKGSTCVITSKRFGASRHGDSDMASTKNTKNSLYFHKSKKKRKNKHKHNQRSKIEDVVKNIVNKRDIDFVAKALTEINLTEDVSATIKKKSTQTHITPV